MTFVFLALLFLIVLVFMTPQFNFCSTNTLFFFYTKIFRVWVVVYLSNNPDFYHINLRLLGLKIKSLAYIWFFEVVNWPWVRFLFDDTNLIKCFTFPCSKPNANVVVWFSTPPCGFLRMVTIWFYSLMVMICNRDLMLMLIWKMAFQKIDSELLFKIQISIYQWLVLNFCFRYFADWSNGFSIWTRAAAWTTARLWKWSRYWFNDFIFNCLLGCACEVICILWFRMLVIYIFIIQHNGKPQLIIKLL